MEFCTQIPVRFDDVDAAQVVYYPRIFHYYHVAFEDFFSAATELSYPQWVQERRVGFPTVHVEGDFHRPFRYGDSVEVQVRVTRVGTKSVDFSFAATGSRESAGPDARATITKTCVDLNTFQAQEIPSDLRQCLLKVAD